MGIICSTVCSYSPPPYHDGKLGNTAVVVGGACGNTFNINAKKHGWGQLHRGWLMVVWLWWHCVWIRCHAHGHLIHRIHRKHPSHCSVGRVATPTIGDAPSSRSPAIPIPRSATLIARHAVLSQVRHRHQAAAVFVLYVGVVLWT